MSLHRNLSVNPGVRRRNQGMESKNQAPANAPRPNHTKQAQDRQGLLLDFLQFRNKGRNHLAEIRLNHIIRR